MFKSLLASLGVLAMLSIITWLFQDVNILIGLAGGLGIFSLLLSGFYIGGLNREDRIKAKGRTETHLQREQRTKWSARLLIFGLPLLVAALISYSWM
ncbi:hypothetical protein CathTA2_1064 [Caldalkalibacillus thermarum TA2.A1]|uniref:DUF5316 domain-containing protein n=1 Tax=Caldalkalibacillus thermarum (strain TA2.A1) TaxID=986075 RepID=F5L5K1_CALTT|nr:DUF5316 family protein [Caldalkalibacillus thermarum]EGL83399.1 hypothetical protein CathTA2_1064 [Caldalkalibacillus thermarum TA2.A1]QZT34528.1 DUF5316 domain-containing protein [Caldalkalibacillus thermarum TA2.A1]